MSLKKAIEASFEKAYTSNDGNDWRAAVDLFTQTQVDYESDIRFLKGGIISDPKYRGEWKDFKESVVIKIRKGRNGNMLADHEIDLVGVIAFCNSLSRKPFAEVFKDRFLFSLCSVFH